MTTAIICDLDGLLADTEKHHLRTYQETLADYGVKLAAEEYIDHWIRNGFNIADFVRKRNLDLDPAEVHSRKVERYRAAIRAEVDPMPGAIDFLHRFGGVKRLALASSSYRVNVELVLGRLGIGEFFEVVVCRDDVAAPKPAPEAFLQTATLLGEEPPRCVVLEDAQKGVEAAGRARMKCIAVPNKYTIDDDFSSATAIVSSLDEITVEFIDSLG